MGVYVCLYLGIYIFKKSTMRVYAARRVWLCIYIVSLELEGAKLPLYKVAV